MKTKFKFLLVSLVLVAWNGFSQEKKSNAAGSTENGDIYMTWNKNTPESEMNDDIKALAQHGVTITYSDVKRNKEGEITAIKVSYSDKNGNTGSLAMDNQKPINIIKIYKQGDEIGFGEPADSNFMGSDMAGNFFGSDKDMMKGFQFNGNGLPGQSFNFKFPNGNSFGQSSSKIIIKKDGKKPLVIENGNVVEGGDDYTKEEIEEIKKNNQPEIMEDKDFQGLGFNGYGNLQDQMKKMQEQLDQLMEQQSFAKTDKPGKGKPQLRSPKEEMDQAKEEMEKAKKELENAKKEYEKAKSSSLKTQKA